MHILYEDESADFRMIVPNILISDRAQSLELYNSLFNKPVGLLLLGEYPTIRVTGMHELNKQILKGQLRETVFQPIYQF